MPILMVSCAPTGVRPIASPAIATDAKSVFRIASSQGFVPSLLRIVVTKPWSVDSNRPGDPAGAIRWAVLHQLRRPGVIVLRATSRACIVLAPFDTLRYGVHRAALARLAGGD